LQELAQQGSFDALSAHSWTLRAVAEPEIDPPVPGQAALLPGMLEGHRTPLRLNKPSALGQTITPLLLDSGTFASQLQGLAVSLLSVLRVCHLKSHISNLP
jgi:hypothetical protein